MDLNKLREILKETTIQLRKGEAVEERQSGRVQVVEIFNMPHESEVNNIEKIDCHFITIGVHKDIAEQYRDELNEILKTYPSPERLAGGPSYIEVGGVIGDQGTALQLFALGQVLNLWKIITPKTLGFSGKEANALAGQGMVMISGFKVDTN